jgi:hypothetical protein
MERFPGDVQRFSFADDLYAVCRALHGMTTKDPVLLQRVGVAQREKDPGTWIRCVDTKIREAQPRVAVITDVRFPNEFDFVKRHGGVCWKVERRLSNGSLFVDPSRPADHVSEVALDTAPWDRLLENPDGHPEAFTDRVLCAYVAQVVAWEAA